MARIASIKWNDTGNGPGVNVSVFMQGCHFHCEGCFNPSTWDFNSGTLATADAIDSIIEGIRNSRIERNLSVLGGEPLNKENRGFVAELITKVRETYPKIKIWIWSGYELDELISEDDIALQQIVAAANAIVIGRFHLAERNLTLRYAGSSNQRILDLDKSKDLTNPIYKEM